MSRLWCLLTTDPTPYRCGTAARLREDSLRATASPATGWLLVEARGPWSRKAFEDSPLDPVAGQAIAERARAIGVRPLFVRRHGRADTEQRFAFVDSVSETVSWGAYERLDQVLAHEWTATEPMTDPVFLTCTHGRHDQCCAIAGRPVAEQFHALRPDSSWECSHLGGDRFAGNVVVLPWGLYYGFMDPLEVGTIVAATDRGEVYLPLLRGRSTDAPVVQAARIEVQSITGRLGIDDLILLDCDAQAPGSWRVRFQAGTAAFTVQVTQHRVADARATCSHQAPVAMRELRATMNN